MPREEGLGQNSQESPFLEIDVLPVQRTQISNSSQKCSKARSPNHSMIKGFPLPPHQELLVSTPPCSPTRHLPRPLSPGCLLRGLTATTSTFVWEVTDNKTDNTQLKLHSPLRLPCAFRRGKSFRCTQTASSSGCTTGFPLTLCVQPQWVLRSPNL